MDLHMRTQGKINQPCAACRMLRRKCVDNCLLAPYFPADEAENFADVHKVFGASNVTKMLQMVEETKREDAVKSMVYEATARLRNPVYGSAGAIFHLQQHVQDLAMQLELTKTRVHEEQEQRDQLLGILMNVHQLNQIPTFDDPMFEFNEYLLDDYAICYDAIDFSTEFDWILQKKF
ncbi:hypothetical protein BVC80_1101g45 [Macleaya cordata]|uniref:LOB domain-containing protein n=1 Tax=Macleaya cordata TaxID=56857 RepID=A0A200QCP9_MACCD|nr:hypothetical protein BVC80_1101g45 [Macleaya cordata]